MEHERRSASRRARAERALPGRRDGERRQRASPPASRCPASRSCGTTAARMSGNWIYCGGYTEEGNLAARRDTADAPNKHRAPSEVGMGVADEPAHSLQPRLGQSQRRAVQPAQMGHPLERREEGMGRRCPRRRHAAGRDESLHHAGIGGRAALLAGPRGRAVSRALRAGGEPGEKPVLQDPVESLRADLAVHRI